MFIWLLEFRPSSLQSDILSGILKYSESQNTQLFVAEIHLLYLICSSNGNKLILEIVNKKSSNFPSPEGQKLDHKCQKSMRSLKYLRRGKWNYLNRFPPILKNTTFSVACLIIHNYRKLKQKKSKSWCTCSLGSKQARTGWKAWGPSVF